MASKIPLKTTTWRISPSDYVALLHDAEEQLSPVREAYRTRVLSDYRLRVESATGVDDIQWAQSRLRQAEERLAEEFEPRWYLYTRNKRQDTPVGPIDDIAPTIEMPERYIFASAILRGGDHSIDITLSAVGPSITLSGNDEAWLRHSQRWANEVLKTHRQWWWWLLTKRGGIAAVATSGAIFFLVAVFLPQGGVPQGVATLIALALDWALLLGVLIAIARFRSAIRDSGKRQVRAFWIQTGLVFAGGVLGFRITRIGDALFPA